MGLDDFKVLSFDCYGTLIDWETGILAQLKPFLAGHGVEVDDATILQVFGQAESQEERAAPEALYREILWRVHARLTTHWGLAADSSAAADFGDSVPAWPAFPDSRQALSDLKERYRLVILSNVDRDSFAESELRLGVNFDAIYTAEDIGSYKPDPLNFAYLLDAERREGYQRDEILHVAQSQFHDHVPASAAGIETCWVQRPSPAGEHGATRPPDDIAQVDFHFRSLAELAAATRG